MNRRDRRPYIPPGPSRLPDEPGSVRGIIYALLIAALLLAFVWWKQHGA